MLVGTLKGTPAALDALPESDTVEKDRIFSKRWLWAQHAVGVAEIATWELVVSVERSSLIA